MLHVCWELPSARYRVYTHILKYWYIGITRHVSRARKETEEEGNTRFPTKKIKVHFDCYSWYQLQLPRLEARPTCLPIIGALPGDGKWGTDFLLAMLPLVCKLVCLYPNAKFSKGQNQLIKCPL